MSIICPSCNSENEDGARFCECCGAEIPSQEEKIIESNVHVAEKFVNINGANHSVSSLEDEFPVANPYENNVVCKDSFESLKEEIQQQNLCPECNSINDPDNVFCENCGSKISNQSTQNSSPIIESDQGSIENTEVPSDPITSAMSFNVGIGEQYHIGRIPPQVAQVAAPPQVAQVAAPQGIASQTFASSIYSYGIKSNSAEISFCYNSAASFIVGQLGVLQYLAFPNNYSSIITKIDGTFILHLGNIQKNVSLVGELTPKGWMLKSAFDIPSETKGQILVDGYINVWFEENKPNKRYKVESHSYVVKDIKDLPNVEIKIDQSGNDGVIHGNNTVYIPGLENPQDIYTKLQWDYLSVTKVEIEQCCNCVVFKDEDDNHFITINKISENDEFQVGRSSKLRGKHFFFTHRNKEKQGLISRNHLKFNIIDDEVDVIDESTNGAHFYNFRNNLCEKTSIGKISLGEKKNICCTRSRTSSESLVELVAKSFEDRDDKSKIGCVGLKLSSQSIDNEWISRSSYHLNVLAEKTIKVDEFLGIYGECHEFSNKNNILRYRKRNGQWVTLNDGDTIYIGGKKLKIQFIFE